MARSFPVLALAALIALTVAPSSARAAAFEVAGWIPYWAVSSGTKDAREHLAQLDLVYPFSYSVDKEGKPKDLASMGKSSWKRLIREAKDEGVAVVPTVMWSDTANIQRILSDATLRGKHVKAIADLVRKERYDGIDIDYEGKLAATRTYYSAFLKELKAELGGKILSCTIEARTPPESLYTTVPKTLEYANDFKEINKYCDRVNLMTYDQQRADLKLNSARSGAPYYPVADPDWVRKVVTLAAKDIAKDKLMIGVATYGREVALTVSPNWFQAYSSIRSVNPEDAEKAAKKTKVKASENKAGEQSFTYLPSGSAVRERDLPSAPRSTASGEEIAQRALAYANKTGKTLTVNLVWWSDANAVADKVKLAKELGVRGVSIFKIDGNEDEDIWDLF